MCAWVYVDHIVSFPSHFPSPFPHRCAPFLPSLQVVAPSSLVPPPPTGRAGDAGGGSYNNPPLSALWGKLGEGKEAAAASAGKLVDDIRNVARENNKRQNKDYMVRGVWGVR